MLEEHWKMNGSHVGGVNQSWELTLFICFYAESFFCFNKPTWPLVTWENTHCSFEEFFTRGRSLIWNTRTLNVRCCRSFEINSYRTCIWILTKTYLFVHEFVVRMCCWRQIRRHVNLEKGTEKQQTSCGIYLRCSIAISNKLMDRKVEH